MFQNIFTNQSGSSAFLEITIMLLWAFIFWFLFGQIIASMKSKKIIKKQSVEKIKKSYTKSKKYWLFWIKDQVEDEDEDFESDWDTQNKSNTWEELSRDYTQYWQPKKNNTTDFKTKKESVQTLKDNTKHRASYYVDTSAIPDVNQANSNMSTHDRLQSNQKNWWKKLWFLDSFLENLRDEDKIQTGQWQQDNYTTESVDIYSNWQNSKINYVDDKILYDNNTQQSSQSKFSFTNMTAKKNEERYSDKDIKINNQTASYEKTQNLKSSIDSMHTKNAKDQLTRIEWIGPKIEELLNKEWIHTFKWLAATDPYILTSILTDAGTQYQMHNPKTWPVQAALARDKRFAELSDYQKALKWGKE